MIITIMAPSVDSGDIRILRIIQDNCRLSAREISGLTGIRVTTVFAKIKRMERSGFIKAYRAVLDGGKLDVGTTAFIFVSFSLKGENKVQSQRKVARMIAGFSEVQEVHIISGEWDILAKVKARDVDSVGKFVVDKLRLIGGIEKTLTSFVFESEKESTIIPL